jgi:hypothetical protein
VLALAAATVGCGPFGDDVDGSLDALTDAVRESDRTGVPFRLASVTSFEWDRVYVFGPYSTPEQIREQLGFDWPAAEDSKIEDADWMNLLVFVRDGRVVHAYEHDRGNGDLEPLARSVLRSGGLSPNDAVLRVAHVRGGGPDRLPIVVLARSR